MQMLKPTTNPAGHVCISQANYVEAGVIDCLVNDAHLVKPVFYYYPGCCMPHAAVPRDQGRLWKLHTGTHHGCVTAIA